MTVSDEQKVFNAAYRGLRWQGFEKCQVEGKPGLCLLNGPGGTHCAVGWLAPNPSLFGAGLDFAVDWLRENRGIRVGYSFLKELQIVHDHARSPLDLEGRLVCFANKHGLEIPSPWTPDDEA